ncbi:MAG: hypothetical protein KDD60_00010 [Bdellovibrionales bacterium]|nr:hypothetical protein [Bdellovibrionales bacterium]
MNKYSLFAFSLFFIVITINPAFACDELEVHLSGVLARNAAIYDQTRPTIRRSDSGVYNVPLDRLGVKGEKLALLFTRSSENTWRVDVLSDASGRIDLNVGIKNSSAATLLDFDEEGNQVSSQEVEFYPLGGLNGKVGSRVRIALTSFRLTEGENAFSEELYVDNEAACFEPAKIISVKSKADSVRDELNPYGPGEYERKP